MKRKNTKYPKYQLTINQKGDESMKLRLEDLACLHPDQVLIEFSPEEREQAW
ncbi:MAG: hypothetical protein F6K56_45805, partial [Moorea sp. SIO3G5]|nr:hypothetical protein [Moorena sp. SIO3G5]